MTKVQRALTLKDIKENLNSIDDKYGFNVNFEIDEIKDDCNIIEKELKAIEIISQNFKLAGNCLHAENEYAEDGWVFVKEIEDEEELEAWKEVLK